MSLCNVVLDAKLEALAVKFVIVYDSLIAFAINRYMYMPDVLRENKATDNFDKQR